MHIQVIRCLASAMASNVSLLADVKDVLFGGIRPDIPGHGGEACANFLSTRTLALETATSTTIMAVLSVFAGLTYTMPKHYPRTDDFLSKRVLLVFLGLLFGIEIGYKLCSKQVLYLLNPCHLITVAQVCRARLSCTVGGAGAPGFNSLCYYSGCFADIPSCS